MLAVLVLVAFVVVVGVLTWRTRDSSSAPKSCCGNRPWPPDDLTGRRDPR